MQDLKIAKKSPSGHHRTTLSGYIFATKARIDNRKKKLVKQQCLAQMSSQYGEHRPTSRWDLLASFGHPRKFQRYRVLAALLYGTLVVGVSQTLRRWTEGANYIRQVGHHVGHWPGFLVHFNFNVFVTPPQEEYHWMNSGQRQYDENSLVKYTLPSVDTIWAMMIVWRRENYQTVLCTVVTMIRTHTYE